ncbi:MAG TPA: thiol:disulfide interchange protein, partial [Burkholderiales bacterium]
MNPVRRTLVALIALAPFAARAQRADYYELNPPQPVQTGNGKIEVLEFFWYGCIHCYNLEPKLETWLKALPKDVEFRRVPAVF